MKITLRLALLCGLLSCAVQAAQLTYTARGERQTTNFVLDGSNHSASTGSFIITVDSTAGLRALCVDPRTSISLNDSFAVNALRPENAIANWQQVSYLVETYMNPNGASYLGTGSATASSWAGLQLAVWDLVTDIVSGRGFNNGAGTFYAQASLNGNATIAAQIRNNADSFLMQAANNGHLALGQATVWQHVDGPSAKQMLISYGAFYPDAQVPEPGTWAMMIAGGAVLAIAGRKRLRKQ